MLTKSADIAVEYNSLRYVSKEQNKDDPRHLSSHGMKNKVIINRLYYVLLNFGRLSDMFGRVKLYNMGFALFTFGSGLCSISQTGEQLILFRIIQALGGSIPFLNSGCNNY